MITLSLKGRTDYLRSVIATNFFLVVYTFLENRYRLNMNTYVRVLILLTIFFDSFFGYYFDMYVSSFVFDKALHVFGTYAFSLFTYILVMQMLTNPLNSQVKFILVICLGLSLGTVYEILEFITDSISHPIPPSQPSLLDTDLDLIADLIGAVLAAFHVSSRKFVNKEF